MTFQLVPLDDHSYNIAKKAFQFRKDHFISVLSGVSATFPLHLWCQVTPQAEKKLLLLRQSNVNNKILLYTHLYGNHDYYAIPFAPIGMEALIHKKPSQRKTWYQQAVKVWVLDTSDEHYCCWRL